MIKVMKNRKDSLLLFFKNDRYRNCIMNQYRTGFWSSVPPVTKNLIIINALCWLATVVFFTFGF